MVAVPLAALLAIGTAALLWSLPEVGGLAQRSPRTTAFIELRRQEAEQSGRRFALRWTWRSLDRISPFLQHAVVVSEDARFWQHDGVDWDAIESAAERNWRKRRIAGGGSTITQQLAKNLYLSPSRNPVRKLRELLIARRLEAALSKDRVLELYLNVAEWGEGVFGAEAAARRWFGHSAAELTPIEAGRLAVALPNPRERAPSARSAALGRKVLRLVKVMWRDGLVGEDVYQQALAELGASEGEPAAPGEAPAPPPAEALPPPAAEPGPPHAAEPAPPPPAEADAAGEPP
jgi:monofunctional biosynthetic peptidoglycan transglycosylase